MRWDATSRFIDHTSYMEAYSQTWTLLLAYPFRELYLQVD